MANISKTMQLPAEQHSPSKTQVFQFWGAALLRQGSIKLEEAWGCLSRRRTDHNQRPGTNKTSRVEHAEGALGM